MVGGRSSPVPVSAGDAVRVLAQQDSVRSGENVSGGIQQEENEVGYDAIHLIRLPDFDIDAPKDQP